MGHRRLLIGGSSQPPGPLGPPAPAGWPAPLPVREPTGRWRSPPATRASRLNWTAPSQPRGPPRGDRRGGQHPRRSGCRPARSPREPEPPSPGRSPRVHHPPIAELPSPTNASARALGPRSVRTPGPPESFAEEQRHRRHHQAPNDEGVKQHAHSHQEPELRERHQGQDAEHRKGRS